jgi:hypothetical protein
MSSRIDPFAVDIDTIGVKDVNPQMEEHVEMPNRPCNCHECVAYALVFGVVKCTQRTHPVRGELVWVPEMTDGDAAISALSADHVRKYFQGDCRGDIKLFYSGMIAENWRASRKEMVGGIFVMKDKVKRKARDSSERGGKKGRIEANSAMSASDCFPRADPDSGEQSGNDDNEDIVVTVE